MKIKSSSALFKRPKIGGHLGPLPLSFFFSKSTDQNFEIAIFLSIVKKHNKMSLGTTYSPIVPGGGATSYKL